MRKNIASITGNMNVSLEEFDTDEMEVHSQMQLESALDTDTVSNEIQSIADSRLALENLHESLLTLKAQGKGLSLESSQFVQYYINDIGNKLGASSKSAALESYSDDNKRLDIALESVTNKLSALIMSNLTGVGWVILKVQKHFQDSEAKNLQLKRDLEVAISSYEKQGQTSSEEITGSFGSALLKDNQSKPSNSVVIANVKQFTDKVNDPAKEKAIKTIVDAGGDIIKMIRSNWFFTSNSENTELKNILEELKTAIQDYAKTEQDVIGQGKIKLEFDDEGEPSLQKNVVNKETGTITFKPLNDNEFKELSRELIKLADLNIEIGKKVVQLLDKTKSVMGWSWVNGIFRLGPMITATVATVAATAVAGPVAGAVVGGVSKAVRVPSRDIYQAMRYSIFVNILREFMSQDAMQRAKVIAEGTLLIKKSTA